MPEYFCVLAGINMVAAFVGMTWLVQNTFPDKFGKYHLAVRRAEEVWDHERNHRVTARLLCVRQRYGRSRRGAVIRVHGGSKTRQRRDGQCEESAMHVRLQFG